MRPITGPSPRQALSVTIRRGGAATNYPILGRPARNTCTCQKFSKAAPCCQNCNCETITAHGRMGFWSGLQSSVDPGGLGHLIWVQWACKSRSDLPTTKMLLLRAGEWRAVKKIGSSWSSSAAGGVWIWQVGLLTLQILEAERRCAVEGGVELWMICFQEEILGGEVKNAFF